MLAHTLGNPFNLAKVKALCEKYDLWLVEDCCDALYASFDGKMVGTWGDIATVSFYPAHHITMGEGGAVFTNNSELIKIAESFRDWGRDCYCAQGVTTPVANALANNWVVYLLAMITNILIHIWVTPENHGYASRLWFSPT